MKTGQGLADYAASLLSNVAETWYMYGNNGHKITEQFIQTKKIQYPDRYSDAHVTELRKHIGAIGYDCSSITDVYTLSDRSGVGYGAADVFSLPSLRPMANRKRQKNRLCLFRFRAGRDSTGSMGRCAYRAYYLQPGHRPVQRGIHPALGDCLTCRYYCFEH